MQLSLSLLEILLIEFFVFSCAGWLMEVMLKYIQFHKFINRGFLVGPYCPIYGWGVVTLTILVGGITMRHGTVWETFFAGMVICGCLEYLTSWYMEKLFHARWWDYSQKPMNLHGRIWIGNLILFGFASVIIVRWISPPFFHTFAKLPKAVLHTCSLAIMLVMVTDYIVSHILMNLVRKEIDRQEGDNTEEISLAIHHLLHNRTSLIRRIHLAYPHLQAHPRRLTQQVAEARRAYRKAVHDLKQELRRTVKNSQAISHAKAARQAAYKKLVEAQAKLRIHWEADE